MTEINSVVIVDSNEIDNFINQKALELHGIREVKTFKKLNEGLLFLNETDVFFDVIIVGNAPHTSNGFEFIDKFCQSGLNTKHGKVILLSAYFTPDEIEEAKKKQIPYLLKPFMIEQLH